MVALAGSFYLQSTAGVPSRAVRGFIAAVCLAAALPYTWVVAQLILGRRPIAVLSALTCAVAYLFGFGWFAVLLALFSWGDLTLWLPAAGLPFQVVALVAGGIGWRRFEPDARRGASRTLAVGVPLLLTSALLIIAARERTRILELPQARQSRKADGDRIVSDLQRCLINASAQSPHGYPASLAPGAAHAATCGSEVRAARSASGMAVEYWAAPPNAEGRRPGFVLCLRPLNVPDAGRVTIVADERGVRSEGEAREDATAAVPCSNAWNQTLAGVVKQLRHCAFEFATRHARGYPATLAELDAGVPGCLGPPARMRRVGTHMLMVRSLASHDATIRYLAEAAVANERIENYRLYAECPAGDEATIIDADGTLLNSEGPGAHAWLSDCGEDSGADLAAVEPEPDFGAHPDLESRRRECRDRPTACYGLGRELERAVRLAGGEPDRFAALSERNQELMREADESFDRACAAGSARACAAQAAVLLKGRAAAADPARSLELLKRSCDAGYALACTRRAELHEYGHRAMRPVPTSLKASLSSASRNLTVQVADATKPAVAKDLEQAIAWHQRACTAGDSTGCGRAARLTLESAPPGDVNRQATALAQYRHLCEQGKGYGCAALAEWAIAHGGRVEDVDAAEWKRRGCVLGGVAGCE